MKARVGFVVEQVLGHVAYGTSLRRSLADRDDIECVWIGVPFAPGRLRNVPMMRGNWALRGSLRASRAISAAHREAPLDALFIHTQTISLFAGGHMERIPTLLSLDATPKNLDELAGPYTHSVGNARIERLKRAAYKRVMRRARHYTAWSQWAKDSLTNHYDVEASKITVVHPGTVLSDFPEPAPKPIRSGRPLRVLFVGGDFERKGGDLLLDVFDASLRGICELHLVTSAAIAPGEGVHVYAGLKPHSPELLKLYRDCDVFVLPTRGDCLAVVLGEAMASSLPILTTNVGAHAEAVEEGVNGYIIGVDDAVALRDRLQRLAAEPALVAAMGARSRAIGEDRFDMGKGANILGDILVRIAQASNETLAGRPSESVLTERSA